MIATIPCLYHHHSLLFTTSFPRSTHHSRRRKISQHWFLASQLLGGATSDSLP
jgi:hypothetical protein